MWKFTVLVAVTLLCFFASEISGKPAGNELDDLRILLNLEKRLLELKRKDGEEPAPGGNPGPGDATGGNGDMPPPPEGGGEMPPPEENGEMPPPEGDGEMPPLEGDGEMPPPEGDGDDGEPTPHLDGEADGNDNGGGEGHTFPGDEEGSLGEGNAGENGSRKRPHGNKSGSKVHPAKEPGLEEENGEVPPPENENDGSDQFFDLDDALETFVVGLREMLDKIKAEIGKLDFADAVDDLNEAEEEVGKAIEALLTDETVFGHFLKIFKEIEKLIYNTQDEVAEAADQQFQYGNEGSNGHDENGVETGNEEGPKGPSGEIGTEGAPEGGEEGGLEGTDGEEKSGNRPPPPSKDGGKNGDKSPQPPPQPEGQTNNYKRKQDLLNVLRALERAELKRILRK